MKALWILLSTLSFLFIDFEAAADPMSSLSARTPSSGFTCKYISGDVGTITGRGSSKNAALADAAEQCFDRRVHLYERSRGPVDMDRGQDFIDSCVNIQCS